MRRVEDALRSVAKYMADALPEYEVRLVPEEGTFKRPFCRVGLAGPTPQGGSAAFTDYTQPMALHVYPPAAADPEAALLGALDVEERLHQAIRRGAGKFPTGVPTPVATIVPHGGSLAADTYVYQVTALGRRGESLPSEAETIDTLDGDRVMLTWAPVYGARSYRVYRGGCLIANVETEAWADYGTITQSTTHAVPTVDTVVVGGPDRIPLYQYDSVALTSPAIIRGFSDHLRVLDFNTGRAIDPSDERIVTVTSDLRVGWRRIAVDPTESHTILQGVHVGP